MTGRIFTIVGPSGAGKDTLIGAAQGYWVAYWRIPSFIVTLGIVVDDAIVVGENVHSHQQSGQRGLQGAIAGVPLVLSRATGHLEMFTAEREALFCDIGDPDSTARQMARIIDDNGLAERLRSAAFQCTSRWYSIPVVTAQILHALETIHEKWHKDSLL